MFPALLLLSDPAITLRRDAPALTQDQAQPMTPVALADALLARGHPPIVERVILPDEFLVPPQPSSPLDVRLFATATLDRPSGFCVKRSWRVSGTAAGTSLALEPAPTLYRLPSPDGRCETSRFMAFFTVAPDDRPRAFQIVRMLAATQAHRVTPGKVIVDDRIRGTVSDGVPPLAIDRIFAIRRYIVTPLLAPADRIAPDGRPRETWEMYVGDRGGAAVWSIHLALDGDRIAAVKLVHDIPPPF